MINITGIFNFKENHSTAEVALKEVMGEQASRYNAESFISYFPSGLICSAALSKEKKIYDQHNVRVFIFGHVFSNIKYQQLQGRSPHALSAKDVCEIYEKFETGIVEYIKGNFVVIIYDGEKKEIFLISSRMNMLPVYYFCDDNRCVFSSSLGVISKILNCPSKINKRALIEKALFYYPLAGKTCFENIFQLPNASMMRINKDGFSIKKYWSAEKLFDHNIIMEESEALDKCLALMKENLKIYTEDAGKFLLSLTGGFDSRLNLALLDRGVKDFLCYSYGRPGSKQIKIPMVLSQKFNLDYNPVYLDEGFERDYESYALKALKFSDGDAPVSRGNFIYPFEKLCSFSRVNITGICGSDVIRPFRQANQQVSQETMDLFFSEDFDKALEGAVTRLKQKGFFNSAVIDEHYEEIKNEFKEKFIDGLKPLDKIHRFQIFLLEEAIRKYFMQEIRIERYYVDTRAPYFDDDFLELIFKTPFAGIYKGVGKTDIFSRRKSQLFYAKAIQAINPGLGDVITDKGYKPKDLLLPFVQKALKVGLMYFKEKMKRRIKGDDTFNAELTAEVIKKYIGSLAEEENIFAGGWEKKFQTGVFSQKDFAFLSVFSSRLWLHLLNENI